MFFVYAAEHYNYCIVPDTGFDAILFAAIGILLACTLPKKYYAILVLVAGMVMQISCVLYPVSELLRNVLCQAHLRSDLKSKSKMLLYYLS